MKNNKFDIDLPQQINQEQQKLNRYQRRKLIFSKKHHPEFTKNFCKQNCKSNLEKRNKQFRAIEKRLKQRDVWEEMRWKVIPKFINELKKYKLEEMKKLNII